MDLLRSNAILVASQKLCTNGCAAAEATSKNRTVCCAVREEKRIWPPQQILYSGVPNIKAVHLLDDGYVKSKFD